LFELWNKARIHCLATFVKFGFVYVVAISWKREGIVAEVD